jgi:hypothetical protein
MPDDFTHQGESAATQWDKFPYFVCPIDTLLMKTTYYNG